MYIGHKTGKLLLPGYAAKVYSKTANLRRSFLFSEKVLFKFPEGF